jgi:hypothetical protein
MKKTLFEFYKPEESELKKAWDAGIFTFDANVLLHLYRYSNKTVNELLDILKHLKEKLWLSNQAGYEYLSNRVSVIHKQRGAYDEIKNILNKKLEEISGELNLYKKHSTIEVDNVKESIKKSFEKIREQIDDLSKSHPTYEPIDNIKEQLTSLFESKTGQAFSKERLNEIFKEAQTRYDNDIPPGFRDKGSKKDAPKQSLYGDVILWKQIIEKAKSDNKPVILITDDLKEDWWDKFKGETQGPRKELLREFWDETGQNVYIYQADKFLEYANKLKIGKTVQKETIKEIRNLRLKDQEHFNQSIKVSDSIRKLIESQQKYNQLENYQKIIDRISVPESLKIYGDTAQRLQELTNKYRPININYDLLQNAELAERQRQLDLIAFLNKRQKVDDEESKGKEEEKPKE